MMTVKTIIRSIAEGGVGIKLFTLMDPDGWELPPFRPGAHIDLHLPGELVRTYSLCNDPADDTRYVVAVKREATGRGGSIVLHDEIKVGDIIGVSLPRGGLQLDDSIASFVFIGGGIGVTPFLSAANYLKRTGRTDFKLHVVARGALPLPDLLAPLMESGHVVVHDTAESERPDIAALIGMPLSGGAIACCGPEGMIDAFEQASRGWPAALVHVERFVPPPLIVDPDAMPYRLALARSKIEIDVPLGQTMLSALLNAGIDIPASCCGGICGSCKVDWLEGRPLHHDRVLSPTERERSLMVCVAGSAEGRLVLDL
jgi:vanillate O-demethylase ferredoxin subunit